MLNPQHRPCEICGRSDWEIVVKNTLASVCSDREIVDNGVPLVKGMCRNCGFVYTLQSPLDERLDSYYQASYSSKTQNSAYDYINYAAGDSFSRTLNQFVLSHEYPATGRMIDIGCGKGFFEEAFLAEYPNWRVEGVDPNVRSIDLAREKTPDAVFHLKKFRGADFESGAYDLVCMHTVLNRVPTRVFVREGVDLLKTGGIMSIEIVLLHQAPFELYFADHHSLLFEEHFLALAEEHHLELIRKDLQGSLSRFLFRKVDSIGSPHQEHLGRSGEAMKRRVKDMVAAWDYVFERVNRCKAQGQRLSFYGAGTTSLIILTQTGFPKEQIIGVFENNRHKIGEEFWGLTVREPDGSMRQSDGIVLGAGPDAIPFMRERIGAFEPVIYYGMPIGTEAILT